MGRKNKKIMKKFFVKENLDYLILAIGVLLITVSWPFYIVVNHYMHYLSAPVAIIVVCYGIYVVVERSINPEKWHKWVALGVGFLAFMIWALGVKQPTLRAYLGSDMIVMKSDNDIKQVDIVEDTSSNDYEYVVFFNPNCETCQDVIPKILEPGKTKDFVLEKVRKNIAFLDTTQDYGKEIASENEVETVPSYMYNDGYGTPEKLGYHTDNGTKILERSIGKLREEAKFRDRNWKRKK